MRLLIVSLCSLRDIFIPKESGDGRMSFWCSCYMAMYGVAINHKR